MNVPGNRNEAPMDTPHRRARVTLARSTNGNDGMSTGTTRPAGVLGVPSDRTRSSSNSVAFDAYLSWSAIV